MTEEQFDRVLSCLLRKPHSMGDLYGEFDFKIGQENLDEVLDVLEEVDVLNWRQEPRGGQLIRVYEIRKEARTDYEEVRK